jgi:hypothetical protein
MSSVLAHPVGNVSQRPRSQPPRSPLRLTPLLDKPGPLKHSEMLGDGGLTHVERCGQVLYRCLTFGETGQDRPPSWVGKGGERRAQGVSPHVYHFLVI